MVFPLVKYVLAASFRDKTLLAFLVLVIVGVSLSLFLGGSAITEKDQFAATFTSGALRLGSVFTFILFIVFFIRKSFETRDVEYMLTKPVNRFQFLLAHSLAFAILAFILAIISLIVLALMPGKVDLNGHALWGVSLFIELLLVGNIAMFFAFVLASSVAATLCTLAYYVLSRMIGGVLGVVAAQPQEGLMLLIEKMMLMISIVVPRLDLLTQSSWLIYGVQGTVNLTFVLTQGLVFYGLIFFAALIDFKRKQF